MDLKARQMPSDETEFPICRLNQYRILWTEVDRVSFPVSVTVGIDIASPRWPQIKDTRHKIIFDISPIYQHGVVLTMIRGHRRDAIVEHMQCIDIFNILLFQSSISGGSDAGSDIAPSITTSASVTFHEFPPSCTSSDSAVAHQDDGESNAEEALNSTRRNTCTSPATEIPRQPSEGYHSAAVSP
jgi:hypothetical protein